MRIKYVTYLQVTREEIKDHNFLSRTFAVYLPDA